jgi:hypothetical protein
MSFTSFDLISESPEVATALKRFGGGAFKDAQERRKAIVGTSNRIMGWLRDCKPPAARLWHGERGDKRKLLAMGDSMRETAAKMIDGSFWTRSIKGWPKIVAACAALQTLIYLAPQAAKDAAEADKDYNDKMRARLLSRENDVRVSSGEDPLPDTEAEFPRKDYNGCEKKWAAMAAFFEGNNIADTMDSIMESLDSAVGEEGKDGNISNAIAMIASLPVPPGEKSAAEQREEERLQRAKDLEDEDDWLGGPSDASSAQPPAKKRKTAAAASSSAIVLDSDTDDDPWMEKATPEANAQGKPA